MFSYLKQVVDSVESQLDSILDAQSQPTGAASENQSAATSAISDSQTQAIPTNINTDAGSRIAMRFEKLKEQTKTTKIGSVEGNTTQQQTPKNTGDSAGNQSLDALKEFKVEPMKISKVEVQAISNGSDNPCSATPEQSSSTPNQTPQSLKLPLDVSSFRNERETEGWGDGWNDDLDIPETETTVSDPKVVEDSSVIASVAISDRGDLNLEETTISTDPRPQELETTESTQLSSPEQHHDVLSPQSPSMDLAEQLKCREEQLVRSKVDNAQLHQQLEQASSDLMEVQDLLEQERLKSDQLLKEMQSLRFDYERLKGESAISGGNSDKKVLELTRALSEKEQSIVGLLQEGENLAKDILKCNNTIKKYKKDLETAQKQIAEKSSQLDDAQTKISQLSTKVTTLQDAERYLQEQVKQLMDTKAQLTKKITELEMNVVRASQETVDLKGFIASLETEIAKMKDEREKGTLEVQSAALEEQLGINANLSLQLSSALKITTDLQGTITKLVCNTHIDRRVAIHD
jgi:DNA repair exonuclease SbcCD ATPase subunit